MPAYAFENSARVLVDGTLAGGGDIEGCDGASNTVLPAEAGDPKEASIRRPADLDSYEVVYGYMEELVRRRNAGCSSSIRPAVAIINMAHATPQDFKLRKSGSIQGTNDGAIALFLV